MIKKIFHLNTSMTISATTSWPGGSSSHSYTASQSIVDTAAYMTQTTDLEFLAHYIAACIFIDDGDELTQLSDVSYKVL